MSSSIYLSDDQQFQETFEKEVLYEKSNYNSVDLISVYDSNNLSYSSGQIVFDTSQVSNYPIDYSKSFVDIPIKITPPSGQSYTGANSIFGLASKMSDVSFISGILLSTTQGYQLLQESNTAYQRCVEPLLQENGTVYTEYGDTISFSGFPKSSNNFLLNNMVQQNATGTNELRVVNSQPSRTIPSYLSSAITMTGSNWNPTLFNQVNSLGNRLVQSTTDGSLSVNLHIPLALVHPIFRTALKGPMLNCPMRLTLFISGTAAQPDFCPIVMSEQFNNANGVAPVAGTQANPTISISPNFTDPLGVQLSSCRLTLYKCNLNAQQSLEYEKKLIANTHVQCEYPKYQVYTQTGRILSTDTVLSNVSITNSIIAPSRIYVLSCKSSLKQSSPLTLFPAVYNQGLFNPRQVNLQINGSNLYATSLQWSSDVWNSMQQYINKWNTGNIYNYRYNDFAVNPLIMFDCDRVVSNLPNRNLPVSLYFNANFQAPGYDCDLIFIVETKQCLTKKFSKGGFSIVVETGGA